MSQRGVPDDFLVGSAAEYAAPFVRELAETHAPEPDARIGAWRLLRELGHGGMGTVYLAERADNQFTQLVALKVVRGALALDDHLLERFRSERQILAALEHPGIARLVDGGVTAEGLPWYAMEHVDGVSIDRHAHESSCSRRERLGLFVAICEAVGYAHRQLVVHRDLKPSNVLVTAAGQPKLVDFGVARLLTESADGLATHSPATRSYASPEQLRAEPIAVTDDVYSLGVILHELLTGQRPGTDPDRGAPDAALETDLRAIVTTATAPQASERYPSALALGDDVTRFLTRQPVAARGGDRLYRAHRFVARHGIAVIAAATVLVSLLGGLSLALAQARRADQARDVAQVAAIKASRVSEFLTRVLSLADPNTTVGAVVTVEAAIDSAASWLDRDLATAPDAHAELLLVLANLHGAMGHLDRHRSFADSALAMQERLWGRDDPRLARAIGSVAESRWHTDELATSEPLLRRMIMLGARDTLLATFTVVHGKNLLAISLRDQGRLADAEAVLREVLADRERLDVEYPVGLDHALTGMGHIALADGRPAEAADFYTDVLDRRRAALGPSHPEVANALINLGAALGRDGRHDTARRLYEEGLDMRKATQGDDHPEIGVDLAGLAAVELLAGDSAAAARTYREAARRLRQSHGAAHPLTREVVARLELR